MPAPPMWCSSLCAMPEHLSRRAAAARLAGWATLALASWAAPPALAQSSNAAPPPPAEVARELPDARWRGAATLRFLGLHIYDARLWSAKPVSGDGAAQPLALELQYARALSGQRIAERSIDEMRRIGRFDAATAERWLAAMSRLFPDVAAGDRITGVQLPGRAVRFFVNGRAVGEVAEAEFARLFFGIWLSPLSSEPAMREKLIGGAA